jgi:hypothetical protein
MNSVKTVEGDFEKDTREKGIVHQINDKCLLNLHRPVCAVSNPNSERVRQKSRLQNIR